MEELLNKLLESILLPFSYLLKPEKRIFLGYILSSGILAYYIYRKSDQTKSFIKFLFPRKIWFSKSALTDYRLLFINAFIKVFLLAPLLFIATHIALAVNDGLISLLGFPNFTINKSLGILLFTLSLTIFSDFLSYVLHYFMHRIPFLWEFHKTHHSANTLTPITQYRIHPFELVLNNLKNIITIGFITGIFFYIIGFQTQKITLFGVNIFSFIFLSFGANLRHSHVRLSYFHWLENFLISPFQHQIHHSDNPEHFDKNLGSKLAIWDYLFGTLIRSKEVNQIHFGLSKNDENNHHFLKSIYQPFTLAFKRVTNFKLNKKQKL